MNKTQRSNGARESLPLCLRPQQAAMKARKYLAWCCSGGAARASLQGNFLFGVQQAYDISTQVHGLVKNCRTECSCLQGDSAAPAESERASVRHIRCGGSILTLFGGASNIMNQRPLTRALLGSMFQDSVASLPWNCHGDKQEQV